MKKYIMESIEKSMEKYKSPVEKYKSPVEKYKSPVEKYKSPVEKYKSPVEKYNYNQTHPVSKNELEISCINRQVNPFQWKKSPTI
jgi:predicted RNase H-like nuclease (RuvC/YqgF family)